MRRANHLWRHIADPENLRLAAYRAATGKRYSAAVQTFFATLDDNINELYYDLMAEKVSFGDYYEFLIYEPKPRRIAAPAFREQVVHHALMIHCDPIFERKQVFDSYASRRGKGVLAALNRADKFQRRYAWYLKLDVRDFFGSIHHETVKLQLGRLFKEGKVFSLMEKIVDSYQTHPGRGLPIGNLTSQYLANHYLCGLDHYIKERLGSPAYVRYMDDMVLWHHDRKYLLDAHRAIAEYLATELRQALKPEILQRTERGLPFLGFVTFPYHRRLSRASKRRLFKRAEARYRELQTGEHPAALRRLQSLVAFTDWSDSHQLRRALWARLESKYGLYE